METTPLWERVKENAAPLERGRNVRVLERSFAADTENDRLEKERMVQHYERLVKPSEATDFSIQQDDDPLIHWLSYIKFHQEAFPSDTHAQFLLFERCMRALGKLRKYANDTRFVRVCCMYAEQTDRPSEVFQHLYSQKIGSETAMLWMAWGFVAEKQQNYSFAEQIFEKGIRKKAQPLEKLVQRHRQFQRRMTRHWLNSTQDSQDDDEDTRPRGVLGALSEDSVRRNDRSRIGGRPATATLSTFTDRRAQHRAQQQQQSNVINKNNGSFSIFHDSGGAENAGGNLLDDSLVSFHDRQLEREHERKKENRLETERWNDRGGLSSSYAQIPPTRAPSPTPFAVYVDEECAAEHKREEEEHRRQAEYHRQQRDERTFREREDTTVAERLAKDPLRYVRHPSRLKSDQAAAVGERHQENERHSRKGGRKKSSNIAFNSRLLKDSTGFEQCFQEARYKARFYQLAPDSTNINLFCARKPLSRDDSCMSLDESTDYTNDVSMEDAEVATHSRPPTKQNSSRKSRRRSLKPFCIRPVPRPDTSFEVPTPRNASTASSTIDEANAVGLPARRDEQTINTQLALKELSMMFSSPALGLNDSTARRTDPDGGLGPILNESGISEQAVFDDVDTAANSEMANACNDGDGDTADFESIADLVGDAESNISFARTNEVTSDIENKGEHNPAPRSNSTPGFEDMALRTLQEDQVSGGTGCSSSRRSFLGTIAQSDPLRELQESDLETDPGFPVYVETGQQTGQAEIDPGQNAGLARDASKAAFQNCRDSSMSNTEQESRRLSTISDGGRPSNESEGDTATFSLFGDAMQALQSSEDGLTLDLKDTEEPFGSKST